ncbi:MAG: hypothetical protein PHN56_04790, partial [Candidatus Nanoarchaeia archaeon]|nr:hypothetical protein [Candidatus Nanoarchaeia archaeon]
MTDNYILQPDYMRYIKHILGENEFNNLLKSGKLTSILFNVNNKYFFITLDLDKGVIREVTVPNFVFESDKKFNKEEYSNILSILPRFSILFIDPKIIISKKMIELNHNEIEIHTFTSGKYKGKDVINFFVNTNEINEFPNQTNKEELDKQLKINENFNINPNIITSLKNINDSFLSIKEVQIKSNNYLLKSVFEEYDTSKDLFIKKLIKIVLDKIELKIKLDSVRKLNVKELIYLCNILAILKPKLINENKRLYDEIIFNFYRNIGDNFPKDKDIKIKTLFKEFFERGLFLQELEKLNEKPNNYKIVLNSFFSKANTALTVLIKKFDEFSAIDSSNFNNFFDLLNYYINPAYLFKASNLYNLGTQDKLASLMLLGIEFFSKEALPITKAFLWAKAERPIIRISH